MKHTLICLLLAAGMFACNSEKTEVPATPTVAETEHSTAHSEHTTPPADSIGTATERHVQEIDSLLEGI